MPPTSPMAPFLSILESEGATLLSAGRAAWAAAETELQTLAEETLADLGRAVTKVIADAEGGESIEELETEVLNILQAEVATLLSRFTSGALQALLVFARAAS